jgi:hypothetical protein
MVAGSWGPNSVVSSLVRRVHEDIPSLGRPRGRSIGTHAFDQSHRFVAHCFRLRSICPILARIKLVLEWGKRAESEHHAIPGLWKLVVKR